MNKIGFIDIIKETIELRNEIISEHKVFSDYQRSNPELIMNLAEQLKQKSNVKNIPDFEYIISLKENYIIDDLSKIYKQLIKKNPLLNDVPGGEPIFYYCIDSGLYERQLKEGFLKGDYYNNNSLVTGSNLIIKTIYVPVSYFVNHYLSICN